MVFMSDHGDTRMRQALIILAAVFFAACSRVLDGPDPGVGQSTATCTLTGAFASASSSGPDPRRNRARSG